MPMAVGIDTSLELCTSGAASVNFAPPFTHIYIYIVACLGFGFGLGFGFVDRHNVS